MSTTSINQKIDPKFIVFSLFATKALDIFTTYIALTNGFGFEANPISAYFIETGGFPALIAVGMIITSFACVGYIWVQEYLESKNVNVNYKKFTRYFIYFIISVNYYVIINNMYVIYIGSRM